MVEPFFVVVVCSRKNKVVRNASVPEFVSKNLLQPCCCLPADCKGQRVLQSSCPRGGGGEAAWLLSACSGRDLCTALTREWVKKPCSFRAKWTRGGEKDAELHFGESWIVVAPELCLSGGFGVGKSSPKGWGRVKQGLSLPRLIPFPFNLQSPALSPEGPRGAGRACGTPGPGWEPRAGSPGVIGWNPRAGSPGLGAPV